ncbi:MAG TPA: hypothetical protein VFW38_13645 [Solirubrobacteraceae bacterium]|nr:hypothetical protein [Solirubrobacteraceae bacterium]
MSRTPTTARVAVLGMLLLAGSGSVPGSAYAVAARSSPRHRAPTRAPSGPPLVGTGAAAGEETEQTVGIESVAGDQLVENGLSSPLCKGAVAASLSSASRSDCASSGFVGAAAPSNNYALDVHIDTGAFGLSKGGLLSVVQDIFIAPAWGALEWLAHALVVMLEWCYTLELLGGAGTSTVAHALLQARAGFTEPWLALVLALASLLALYHGLVQRRVADTLGGALTMLAMMAGGLWVIADPGGTVGAVGGWANQASLGTLAASASGSPGGGAATLADGMRALYTAAIETPWCYLEFGNVRWCSDPSRLDPRLRAVALALAAGGKQDVAVPAQAAELARVASTNGALFLAFPANGPQRNSINQRSSLLRAICRSQEATKCTGSAAPEAEFRTDGGTFPRLLGLLAIAVGVLGMALLFGLLALHLLAAAFVGLFLLLLAPLAVLAPAFGDGGRALFTAWLTRLLAAFSSKLLFSFVLGASLTMQRALAALDTLGWWTQWLLTCGFWWTLFVKRHELAAMARSAGRQGGSSRSAGQRDGSTHVSPAGIGAGGRPGGGGGVRPLPLLRRAENALQTYGVVRHPARWAEAQIGARIAQRQPREERPAPGRQKQQQPAVAGRRLRERASHLLHARDRRLSQSARPAEPTEPWVDRTRAAGAAHRSLQQPRQQSQPSEQPQQQLLPSSVSDRRGGVAAPASSAPLSPPRREQLKPPAPALREERSPVMEDAFAVARGRKRQLGYDSEQ